jgi:hypothetical protein
MALASTQPLTEMSTRNLPGGKGRPAGKTDNITAICEPIVLKIWEPYNRMGLHGLLQGQLYLFGSDFKNYVRSSVSICFKINSNIINSVNILLSTAVNMMCTISPEM